MDDVRPHAANDLDEPLHRDRVVDRRQVAVELGDLDGLDPELLRLERHRVLAAGELSRNQCGVVPALLEPLRQVRDMQRRPAHVQPRDRAQDPDALGAHPWMNAIVRRRPSSRSIAGSQPSTSRAARTSAHESRMSPGRGGPCSVDTSAPRMRPISAATSLTLAGALAATLKIRPLAPAASPARSVPSTTLSTYVKSRRWSPSPKISIGRPAAIAVMNRGIIAAYCECGLCRGPNTLK